MELIIIVIAAVVMGFVWGWRTSTRVHLEGFRHILRSLNITNEDLIRSIRKTASPELLERLDLIQSQTPSESQRDSIVEVKLEQHGGQIYAFRKDNDQFLGQGADRDSLIDRLNQTMKPCTVNVAREDGAELLQKNNG